MVRVLVINLARAPGRWALLRESMAELWPDADVERVEGIDGTRLGPEEIASLVIRPRAGARAAAETRHTTADP
jgi:hypothetical protein